MLPAVDLAGVKFHAIFGKKTKITGFRPTFGVGATLWEILDLPLVTLITFWVYIIKGNQERHEMKPRIMRYKTLVLNQTKSELAEKRTYEES